jgi:glycosyltransferase involved in cell wall biosynthesis
MKNDFISRLTSIGDGLPAWIKMASRVPFLFLFALEAFLSACKPQNKNTVPMSQSVSVIIPTKNEENNISACIQSVSANRYVCEIITVDAGSSDRTQIVAQQAGAQVLIHNKPIEKGGGRGGQIRAGIHVASGDIIAILHADTILPDFEIDRIISVLNDHPSVIGGSVGCRFNAPGLQYRFLELANVFRAGFLKISFGDQVQFFRREPVVQNNIFPDIPLMEDVELSIRLHRLGKQVYLYGGAMVSVRRWQKTGSQNAVLIIRLLVMYLIQRLRSAPKAATEMYKAYYGIKL